MDPSRTVLLIEDEPADARLIREMFVDLKATGHSFELLWAPDLNAGLERLSRGGVDVVLLDLGLPGSHGLATVQHLLRQAPQPPTLIVLSGLSDEAIAVQALQAGAQDYLIKGQVDAKALSRAIRYAQGRAQADDALREASQRIECARERAERANQAKSRFLATLSHDLRTPLGGILGFAQLLQSDAALTVQQRQSVDTIRHSGEHLLAMINDILDLAKVESGRFELCPAEVELRGFVRVVADMVQIKALQKPGLVLSWQVADDAPQAIHADERRLRQVLLNLLDNAVKFTACGQVALRVAPTANGRLRFEVADTGQALAPEQIARLFHAFEQVGDAQQRSQGTGLGLVICQQFVRLMGGEIEVQSRAGEGNRFGFTIDVAARRPPGAYLSSATGTAISCS